MNGSKKDVLAWLALAAALTVTASAEYQLALACGFGSAVAAGVPAALDIYAVRALKVGKDVPAVVLAMIAVNAAAHLVAAGMLPVTVPVVVAVSAIAPLVLWRVHRLGHSDQVDTVVDTAPVHQVSTEADLPVYLPQQEPVTAAQPLVSPVDTPVHTEVSTPDLVDEQEPVRLGAEDAAAAIRDGWLQGLSVRETAALSTRSPSWVAKVYRDLEDEYGRRPMMAQLAIAG